MVTVTITNASSSAAIGNGTATPLPGPFAWCTIAASGSHPFVVRVRDMEADVSRLSGFTVSDALQQMVQQGLVTVAMANLADATNYADMDGLVVHDA